MYLHLLQATKINIYVHKVCLGLNMQLCLLYLRCYYCLAIRYYNVSYMYENAIKHFTKKLLSITYFICQNVYFFMITNFKTDFCVVSKNQFLNHLSTNTETKLCYNLQATKWLATQLWKNTQHPTLAFISSTTHRLRDMYVISQYSGGRAWKITSSKEKT